MNDESRPKAAHVNLATRSSEILAAAGVSTPEQQLTYSIGFDDGFVAGWAAAAPTLEQRDEWIARRIRALQLEHEAMARTTDIVVRTLEYIDRGLPRWIEGEPKPARLRAMDQADRPIPTSDECLASWAIPRRLRVVR